MLQLFFATIYNTSVEQITFDRDESVQFSIRNYVENKDKFKITDNMKIQEIGANLRRFNDSKTQLIKLSALVNNRHNTIKQNYLVACDFQLMLINL